MYYLPRFDLQCYVKIQSHQVSSRGQDPTPIRSEKVPRFHLIRAGSNTISVIFRPSSNGLAALSHFFETTNKTSHHILRSQMGFGEI